MKLFRRKVFLQTRANATGYDFCSIYIYRVFQLGVEVIGPLFYIYIILFVLTVHSDTLSGTNSH